MVGGVFILFYQGLDSIYWYHILHTFLYNATVKNNREIDRVHNYELYIATVSIKHKSVDRIKTALQLWLYATR